MASGLGSPFDGKHPDFHSSNSRFLSCSVDFNGFKGDSNGVHLSELFGSGWQNAKSIALIVVESICLAALVCCIYFTKRSKYTWEGKPDKLRINSMRGAIFSTMLAVCLAIAFVVLKAGYACALKNSYPYLFSIFGLGWRSAEVVTAAIVARTMVEQLRNTQVEKSQIVSRVFKTWITILTLATLSSYVLYVLWLARLAAGPKTPYSTKGFAEDYAYIDFGYQLGYLVLALAFLATLIFSLRQDATSMPRRNLLLFIVVPLVIREIEQVVINGIVTYDAANNSTAINLADAIIYDLTTTCLFFALALLGRRDQDEQVGAATGSISYDPKPEAYHVQQPFGFKPYGPTVTSDSYEAKPGPQVMQYSYAEVPPSEIYANYTGANFHF